MNLIQSTVGVDSGLVWEQNLNASLTIVDGHNHTPGFGVPITPAAVNINADLAFNNFSATSLKSLVFTAQPSLATTLALYAIGADLYFNDGNSNVVQITSGGNVNATSSGISNGTATASFVSSVLVVNAASNTPANIQGGSILLGNNLAASKFLTLSPPSAMPANFTLTLPSVPASTNIVTLDNAGNFAAVTNVDNSTLQLVTNTLAIKAKGVTQGLLADRSTGTTVGAGGVAVSVSSGAFSTSSATYVDVTNLSVTITTTGRPVMVMLVSEGNSTPGSESSISWSKAANTAQAQLRTVRDVTEISNATLYNRAVGATSVDHAIPVSSYSHLDQPTAGTYTYKIQALALAGTGTVFVSNALLVAYEI